MNSLTYNISRECQYNIVQTTNDLLSGNFFIFSILRYKLILLLTNSTDYYGIDRTGLAETTMPIGQVKSHNPGGLWLFTCQAD